ncbi:MAG: UbiH/UbiF/VisC/COQ6 family ubiquinone biosynthesis hydroxylase [Acetobacteraceae bacterium]|nr:UbiH/UbiF/VisC/COQ6 family ubiquinone biosynthesis hydroxylase [Acetobacteraceae bacterium]
MSDEIGVDVCIVGAGPVGGTLAARLAGAGVRTALVDRAALPPMEHPDFDGRAYAIAAGSRAVLADAGLWARLPFPANPIRRIRVSDGTPGRAASRLHLHFDVAEAADTAPPFDDAPAFGWMVEARSLRMALNAHLHALPALSVFAPAEAAVDRDDDGATVRIAGGPTLRARLVVAAEGRRSPLRAAAGIRTTQLPYGQTGMVFAIAHEHPHDDTALEHFLPGGPFAQLPMAPTEGAPHLSAIVWTERDALARHLLGFDDARFTREVARRLGGHLGAIRLVGRRWSYPLSAMVVHGITAPRLALVGDAAHGIHPIAGQGLNLGFQDVGPLAELVIAAVEAGEDPGGEDLLRRYRAARGPAVMAMTATTDILDRLFSNNIPPVRLARDLGIAAVNRIAPLKRLFMRRAMGVG